MNLAQLSTEKVNQNTKNIDLCTTEEMLTLINKEDQLVPLAVQQVLPEIAQAVDAITHRLRRGGRLLYIGAGTSGRLGVLDASECPPTFGTDPTKILGLIAGGDYALRNAVEGVEDDTTAGAQEMVSYAVNDLDVVVGITASGRTPFVRGALAEARKRGACTIALCNTSPAALSEEADISILPVVGAEVVMGSTRLKSGTAQKLVLNMLTTAAMIKLGKTFGNLMVDLSPCNEKLKDRIIRIVMEATGANRTTAEAAVLSASGEPKTAILSLLTGCTTEDARTALEKNDGMVGKAVKAL